MNKLLTILLTVLTVSSLLGQDKGTITGIIADSTTQEPLLGVNVIAGDVITNSDYVNGKYTLELSAGEHTVTFRYLGYQSLKKKVTVQAGETSVMNVVMSEAAAMLETATITSSKFEKSLGEATVSIDVIQPKLIENTNAQAVNEVLDRLPGVSTMGDQITIRGGSGFAQGTGSRVLILMDDMPVMQADAGLPNWADLPTENIAQMEVLKGAASALYGSAALNGVINIRTAYPLKKPYTKVSIFGKLYGNPKTKKNKWWTGKNMPFETGIQLAHRRKIGKFDVVLGSNLFYNRSYMRGFRSITDASTGLVTIDSMPGYNHRARVTVNTRYRHSEKVIFTLNTNLNLGSQNVFLFHNRTDTTLGLYESDFDPAPRGQNMRLTVDPALTVYDNFTGRHRFQFRYFYIDNNNEGNQSNSSHTVYGEYQFQRRFEKLGGLEVAAGVVGSHIISDSDVYNGAKYKQSNFGVYAQLDKKFFKKLSVSFGMRYEINATDYPDSLYYTAYFQGTPVGTIEADLTDSVFAFKRPLFRVGLNYQIGKATFLRASFGEGYRFPTVLEQFISTSAGGIEIAPNPKLMPERGWSAEFGIKQGFKIGKWQGFIDLAGFWSEYTDMMEFQSAQNSNFLLSQVVYQVQNIGNTIINGFEVSVMGQGNIGPVEIDLLAGYTFLNPTYKNFQDSATRADILQFSTSEDNILKYRNRHTVKVDAQGTYKGFSLGFTLVYLSFMEAIDVFLERGDLGSFNFNAPTHIYDFRQAHNKGSLMMNARVAYQMTKFAKVSLLVNNFTNMEYYTQPGKLEAPINFSLRADFTF